MKEFVGMALLGAVLLVTGGVLLTHDTCEIDCYQYLAGGLVLLFVGALVLGIGVIGALATLLVRLVVAFNRQAKGTVADVVGQHYRREGEYDYPEDFMEPPVPVNRRRQRAQERFRRTRRR